MEKMNVRKIVLVFADAFIVLLSGVLTSFILSFFYFWTNPMLGYSRQSLIIYMCIKFGPNNILECMERPLSFSDGIIRIKERKGLL